MMHATTSALSGRYFSASPAVTLLWPWFGWKCIILHDDHCVSSCPELLPSLSWSVVLSRSSFRLTLVC